VYFPACINRIFGNGRSSAQLSANRTCEVGLEQATGSVYQSVIFALEVARS